MNIILLTEKDRTNNNFYAISDERFAHLNKVLKCKLDDIIAIGLLNGKIGKAKVTSVNYSEIILEIISLDEKSKASHNIDIICALPRPQTLKKVLAISATMGVSNLFLIRSEKVEKSYFHSPLLKEENYSKFLIDGLSQGKRTDLPKVSIHKYFKIFFNSDFSLYDFKLFAHPNSQNKLSNFPINSKSKILIAVGPEGGWNDFEIEFMLDKGFSKFKLSENILRVEFAVTAALAQTELLFY